VQAQPDDLGGVGDVLVDVRVGEPGQRQVIAVHQHLGFGVRAGLRPYQIQDLFGAHPCPPLVRSFGA
jgi:hypothetical protein